MTDKCTHVWYFDRHEFGNFLVVDPENSKRIYCSECNAEWIKNDKQRQDPYMPRGKL
jgi:hypothetical protein